MKAKHIEVVINAKSILVFGLLLGCVVGILWVGSKEYRPEYVSGSEVFSVVEKEAKGYGLDPMFVFALVYAESRLNAHARNEEARGIMQLTPNAWEVVSERPYGEALDWQKNIEVGCAYLGWLKGFLLAADEYSYEQLAAAYRYGPYALSKVDYAIDQLAAPRNKIYQRIFAGEAPKEIVESLGVLDLSRGDLSQTD